ncbi:hypothetical protein [Streptomyces coerulescens]|uniref:Uncharacterized protein n=1 Tax=Streptomyces coerulescens TaxID=29304 RepID=A0ABW0CGQ1_STRCD
MTDALHVILDDTAMVAAGSGNILASRLIHRAHATQGWFLYAPTCALVEADRTRRGTAEHIVALPGVIVLDLDLSSALAVARDAVWAPAHVECAARPTPERPDGAVVATVSPEQWKRRPVRILDLNP